MSDPGWMFVLNTLGIGGSEKKTVKVANYLAQQGRNIHLAYLNQPDTILSNVDDQVGAVYLERSGKLDLKVPGRLTII